MWEKLTFRSAAEEEEGEDEAESGVAVEVTADAAVDIGMNDARGSNGTGAPNRLSNEQNCSILQMTLR